jgi:hypothetical protein
MPVHVNAKTIRGRAEEIGQRGTYPCRGVPIIDDSHGHRIQEESEGRQGAEDGKESEDLSFTEPQLWVELHKKDKEDGRQRESSD